MICRSLSIHRFLRDLSFQPISNWLDTIVLIRAQVWVYCLSVHESEIYRPQDIVGSFPYILDTFSESAFYYSQQGRISHTHLDAVIYNPTLNVSQILYHWYNVLCNFCSPQRSAVPTCTQHRANLIAFYSRNPGFDSRSLCRFLYLLRRCLFGKLVSWRPRQLLGYIADGPQDRASDNFTCCHTWDRAGRQ